MQRRSLDDIVKKLNSLQFSPENDSYSYYITKCYRLERHIIDLINLEDEKAYEVLRNVVPAFDDQEKPTHTIISAIYSESEKGSGFLKDMLYDTELNEEFPPVTIDDTFLDTKNQMFTQAARNYIAEFLYLNEEIDKDEYLRVIGYENKEDGLRKDGRDMSRLARFYKNLTEEEKDMIKDDEDRPIFYLQQIKNIEHLESEGVEDSDEYDKAIETVSYAMTNDRETFLSVLNHHIRDNNKTTRDDSDLYNEIIVHYG